MAIRSGPRNPLALLVLTLLLALALLTPPALQADEPRMAVLRTRYYRIHTDLDAEFAQDLARRLDGMYDEYQRRLSGFGADKAAPALEVYVFRRQEDYLRFTGERWRNSGGVYMSGRNLLATFLEGQGRDALRRTLQHEAFHQFAHATISEEIPVWLNEGMAQLFEEAIWTGNGFMLGQVPPRRVRQLQADIKNKRLRRFDQLMSVSPEKWAEALAHNHDDGATQYNQSWAMVHFLVMAKDDQERFKYRTRLIRMLQHLHAGKDGKEAFETAFSTNTKGFQDRFVEYARKLTATPAASLVERQEVLADLVVGLRSQGHTFARVADLREAAVRARYTLRYTDRGMAWSTDPDINVYFSDTAGRLFDDGELYFYTRPGAPLPDIVCRADHRLQFRTRFHPNTTGKPDKLEHEILVEPPDGRASAGE